jgi:hypothetical protein
MTKKRKDRVLLLETQLDHRLASRGSEIQFMREFFQNLPSLELIAKEVHSRSDLKKFLDLARKDRSIRAVHIVAHGRKHRSKTSIVLTNVESINLRDPGKRGIVPQPRRRGDLLLLLPAWSRRCPHGQNPRNERGKRRILVH